MTTPESTSSPVAGEDYDVGLSRDGDKIKDPSFYQLFGVKADATDAEIKKSYRRLAVRFHPGPFYSFCGVCGNVELNKKESVDR